MGYTPAFEDIYMGTLYGRWPAAAVWASLLPLLDKNGQIDMSMQAIAGMTGWPMDLLEEGIHQLMEPDKNSRTPDHEGRRLIPIDPDRPWGWKAVNHAKYKEKARLQSKNAREVQTGTNKDRMNDRRRPPETAADPLSNTNTNTNTGKTGGGAKRALATHLPDDFALTPERRAVAEAEKVPADRTFESFCDYWRSLSGQKARKRDWDATWRNWCRKQADWQPKATGPKRTRYEEMMAAMEADCNG